MSFQKIRRTKPTRGRRAGIAVTVHKNGVIGLSAAAYQALGEPVAASLAWDPESRSLLVSVCSPDDPDAVRLDGKAGPKFSGRDLIAQAGLDVGDATRRCPAAKHHTRGAILADFSSIPGVIGRAS